MPKPKTAKQIINTALNAIENMEFDEYKKIPGVLQQLYVKRKRYETETGKKCTDILEKANRVGFGSVSMDRVGEFLQMD